MPLLKCHPENSSQLLSQVITYLSSIYSIWGFSRNLVPKILEMRFFSPVSRMDPWTWFKALLCDCLFVLLLLPRSCTFFSVQPASKQHFLDAKLIWGEFQLFCTYSALHRWRHSPSHLFLLSKIAEAWQVATKSVIIWSKRYNFISQGRPYLEKISMDRTEMFYWLQQERRQQVMDRELVKMREVTLKTPDLPPIPAHTIL